MMRIKNVHQKCQCLSNTASIQPHFAVTVFMKTQAVSNLNKLRLETKALEE